MPDEPPWTGDFMKKKSVANKKRRPTTVGSGTLVIPHPHKDACPGCGKKGKPLNGDWECKNWQCDVMVFQSRIRDLER